MYNIRKLTALGFLLISGLVLAQHSVSVKDPVVFYKTGKTFFEEKQYAAATEQFELFLSSSNTFDAKIEESEYFIVSSHLFQKKQGVETEMLSFIEKYEGSFLSNIISFELGSFYYDNEQYRLAMKAYANCRVEWFTPEILDDFYYQYAYVLFDLKKYKEAKPHFKVAIEQGGVHENKALYYYSFLQYKDENYDVALTGFKTLFDENLFEESVPYYLAQIYFIKERYDELLDFAPALAEKGDEKNKAELNRIVGDAYYKQGDYDEAIQYLEAYQDAANKTLRQDLYHLGVAYYMKKDFARAAETLAKITALNDPLSQSAYSYLGECFVRLEDKNRARLAFGTASKYKFDPLLREDAYYNYVKLSYETAVSPFNGTIALLEGFLSEFPNSNYTTEVYDLMYKSYMTTTNFRDAALSIEKLKSDDPRIALALQRVMYYRGVELYNDGNYKASVDYFMKSISGDPREKTLKAKALYWLGDAYYQLKVYDKAMAEFNAFITSPGAYGLDEFAMAHYNMGYCFFKTHNYNAAINWWRKFVQLDKVNNVDWVADAYNRTGDCYFLKRDFYNAIKYYSLAIDQGGDNGLDYAAYQKGLCQGLSAQYDAKIATLNSLLRYYPESAYADDANFEVARTWIILKRYDEAITSFKQLPLMYPNSKYASKALLNVGLTYYNKGDLENASNTYKQVVDKYKGTEDGRSALLALKNISIDQNSINEYVAYAHEVGAANVERQEQDSLTFTAAERLYMNQDYPKAIAAFKKYNEEFDNGTYVLVSNFFMADAYMQIDKNDDALFCLEFIVKQPRNLYTEQALEVLSSTYFENKEYTKALEAYKQLLDNAEKKENVLIAKTGIVDCNYALGEEGATILAVEQLLKEKLKPTVKNRALYYNGKSYLGLQNTGAAKSSFEILAEDISNAYGAESKYLLAQMLYDEAQYDSSKVEVFDFINKGTSQQYWLAKVFILLSDIFMVDNDLFQAKQYLLSIRDNYKNEDDIPAIVEERLKVISDKEEQENQSRRDSLGLEFNIPADTSVHNN